MRFPGSQVASKGYLVAAVQTLWFEADFLQSDDVTRIGLEFGTSSTHSVYRDGSVLPE